MRLLLSSMPPNSLFVSHSSVLVRLSARIGDLDGYRSNCRKNTHSPPSSGRGSRGRGAPPQFLLGLEELGPIFFSEPKGALFCVFIDPLQDPHGSSSSKNEYAFDSAPSGTSSVFKHVKRRTVAKRLDVFSGRASKGNSAIERPSDSIPAANCYCLHFLLITVDRYIATSFAVLGVMTSKIGTGKMTKSINMQVSKQTLPRGIRHLRSGDWFLAYHTHQ